MSLRQPMANRAAPSQVPTEADRLRAENETLLAELVELQRISALGQLLGTTTHEFNNVLMTIMNYAKMGIRNSDPAFREKSLTRILAASQRANQIANSVLAMARNRSRDLEPTQLVDLVHESLILLEREMQKHRVRVELNLSAVPAIMARGNEIQQVLLNLFINARQAMPQGGRLLVGLQHDPSAQAVDLTIRDFGTGIAPEHLPRIFEPRFTTKSGPDATGKGGSGLGLFTCRKIMQGHGGRIRVESSVGQGTCFTLRFPVAAPAAPIPAPHFDLTDHWRAAENHCAGNSESD